MTTSAADAAWIHQARDLIRGADATHPLCIRGHGSKDFLGLPQQGDATVLSTLEHTGVVDYDPTELVVVARCGTPITEIESLLDGSGQMLAFEPPRFGGRGTVGGMIASGLSGPRRATAGAARDFILGMTVLDAAGTPLRYGGTVMKNVAGYDLSRLHTGALGTLGVIVDVSIKVLPKPPAEATLRFSVDSAKAIDWMNAWAGQPLPISASSWRDQVLTVRLSGAIAAVDAARRRMGGEVLENTDEASGFWTALRDQTDRFFHPDSADPGDGLWRLSLPSVASDLAIDDPQWIEWGGALRWVRSRAPADRMRSLARQCGGHATLFRCHDDNMRRAEGVFAELPPAVMKIHQRLKHELDASGIFNPGRMFAGL